MRWLVNGILTALLFSAGLPPIARADAIALKHVVSLYADDQGRPLSAPRGVACAASGLVVAADTGNGRLVTFTAKGEALLGGGEIRVAGLERPGSVHIEASGAILVLDLKTRALVRLDVKGALLGTVEPRGMTGTDPVAIVAFDADRGGAIYVLDAAGRRVLVLDREGNVTRELPFPADGGIFTDVAVDRAGTIYAIDPVRGVILYVDKAAAAFKPLTTKLKELASFPAHLAADDQGGLFAVDQHGGTIVQLAADGSFRARHAALGWTEGLLFYPVQMCISGNVALVADRSNNRVQVFSVLR